MKSKYSKLLKCWVCLAAFLMGNTSCDDYLELNDPGAISPSNFPTKLEHVELLVTSVYAIQHNWGFLGHNWLGYGIYCLDHTIDFVWQNDNTWISISTGRAFLGDDKVSAEWNEINQGIYLANSAIEGIEGYRAIAPASEQAALNHYEGELIFLRGYYLWHLQTFYGDPNLDGLGMPIIKKVPKSLEEMSNPRATTRETYQSMIDDFKQAAELLKGQTDNHRPTEWSAKAALAKTYLFANKLDSAKIYLEECISNSGKKLVSFDHYRNMYNGDIQYEYNSESFYETNNMMDPTNGKPVGAAGWRLYAPIFINESDSVRMGMGYSNLFMHDNNLFRFGYHDPTPLTQLEQVNGRYSLKQSYIDQQTARRENIGRQEDGPDPRLYVCALQPFFDEVKVRGEVHKVGQSDFGKWYSMELKDGASNNNDPNTFYGWPTRKYQHLYDHADDIRMYAGHNFYFIRLAEIYLMYAEVLKDSDPTKALEYVNKVHRRAYNYDPDSPSPVDYKSLTDKTKTLDANDHLSNDPLLYECWAEIFGEGKWWEYVRRLRLGKKEADYYKQVANGKGVINWRDEHYAMPIPIVEFESNDLMEQNKGY